MLYTIRVEPSSLNLIIMIIILHESLSEKIDLTWLTKDPFNVFGDAITTAIHADGIFDDAIRTAIDADDIFGDA